MHVESLSETIFSSRPLRSSRQARQEKPEKKISIVHEFIKFINPV